jgi:hypothetical protein
MDFVKLYVMLSHNQMDIDYEAFLRGRVMQVYG